MSYIDKDLKAAFGYQPGTYWIMKDSASNELDSFYVTNAPITTKKYQEEDNAYEEYLISIHEHGHYAGSSLDMRWTIRIIPNYADFTYYKGSDTSNEYIYSYCVPLRPHEQYDGASGHPTYIDSRLENPFVLGLSTYNKAYVTEIRFGNGDFATTVLNLEVGILKIIQKDLYFTRSISLVNYHLVK